jgi:hypothetical protein
MGPRLVVVVVVEDLLEEHTWQTSSPRRRIPYKKAQMRRRAPLLWGPPARKGKHLRRQTHTNTAGLSRPDASSGRWFGGAIGGWQTCAGERYRPGCLADALQEKRGASRLGYLTHYYYYYYYVVDGGIRRG